MAFQYPNNRVPTTKDGIPYVWGGGDITTVPSNEVKITSPSPLTSGYFGRYGVAVGCGKIIVGETSYNSSRGAVHVYNLDGTFDFTITASDAGASDQFGIAVSVDEKYQKIIVGAKFWDNVGYSDQGKLYIYNIDGTNEYGIPNLQTTVTGYFGAKNDASNGICVVSAWNQDGSALDSGEVSRVMLSDNSIKTITDPAGQGEDAWFGYNVACGHNRIIASTPANSTTDYGYVQIFDNELNLIKRIDNPFPEADDRFGYGNNSIKIGDGRIVIGSAQDDPDGLSDQGSVYVYDINGNYVGECEQPDPTSVDYFGDSIAIGSGRIVVGAPFADENGASSGCAYVYDLDCNFITKLIGSDTAAGDNFGSSVAIGHNKIIVGAGLADNGAVGSGCVYVFDTPYNYTMHNALEYHRGEK